MPIVPRLFFSLLLLTTWFVLTASADEGPYRISLDTYGGLQAARLDVAPYPRLVAEFEPARALLLSVADWQPHHRHILVEIAQKTVGHVYVVVLCNDTQQMKEVTEWLSEQDDEFAHIYFCLMPLDTVWIRDFGPIFSQTESGTQVLDFYYEGTRPKDDSLPNRWAKAVRCAMQPVPWTIQGGNLMSNGQGTALMSTRIFRDNYIRFPNPDPTMNVEHERRVMVIKAMMESCNLSQLIVLEPLASEETNHVDMFASFISPGDVIVAQVDQRTDPENAQILERNVNRLKQVKIGDQPLRVHRVPIPARRGSSWSAYTNSIMVGNLILLPFFNDDPPEIAAAARDVYAKLIPDATIEMVDMTTMKDLQGELHCLSLHVPQFAALPEPVYSYPSAKQTYFPER